MNETVLPIHGPLPRPESIEQAAEVLKNESFLTPLGTHIVTFETDEFTSVCPRTNQPDFGKVVISYIPIERCLESKALKFYLWAYRNEGAFCEDLAARIAKDIGMAIQPFQVIVTVHQNSRGGLRLTATAEYNRTPIADCLDKI